MPLVSLVIEPIEVHASSEHVEWWYCGQSHERYIDKIMVTLEWSVWTIGEDRSALRPGNQLELPRMCNDLAIVAEDRRVCFEHPVLDESGHGFDHQPIGGWTIAKMHRHLDRWHPPDGEICIEDRWRGVGVVRSAP